MEVNILDYGALADGKTVCSVAVQQAINDCAEHGGGRVTVPAGRFLIGTIRLKSHVELFLSHGAVLKAVAELSEYNETDEYPQNYDCIPEKWCGKHLILCVNQEDVSISGGGTVEGCCDEVCGGELHGDSNIFWRDGYYQTAEGAPLRPGQMISFVECRHVSVTGVTLKKASCWNLWFQGCDYIKVHGLTILGNKQYANTDGIDIDCCHFAEVSDCLIDTGDDCIAIRAAARRLSDPSKKCEYVSVHHCVLSNSTCAVRVGVGQTAIHHVTLSDLILARSGEGITFMTGWMGAGGVRISDVHVHDIISDDVGILLQFVAAEAPVERVTVENIHGNSQFGVKIGGQISDLTLRNMDIYEIDPVPTHPETLERELSGAFFSMWGVHRGTLERVRIYPKNEMRRLLSAKNCTFLCTGVSAVYSNEENDISGQLT